MASVNKVIIIGNLGRDPEMRYMPSGDAIANLRIATAEKYKDRNGEMQESTEWHSVAFFGKTAEVCGQYLKKGSQVYVEGSLRTEEYEKDGVKRYSTDIVAAEMQMLGGKPADSGGSRERGQARGGGSQSAQSGPPQPVQNTGFDDDDIPF